MKIRMFIFKQMTRDSTPVSIYIYSIHKQVIFLLSFGSLQLTKMADQDHQDAAYYKDLSSKILRTKSKNNQRGKKKDIFYIEDLAARRTKISTCTDTLVLQMETQLQTHVKINLQIKNDEGKKVIRSYKSSEYQRPSGDGEQCRLNSNEGTQAEQRPQLPTTLIRRCNMVESTPGSSSGTPGQNGWKIYGLTKETSLWLGCSYINRITPEQECDYWVHQNCIGLHYKKKKENLDKVRSILLQDPWRLTKS